MASSSAAEMGGGYFALWWIRNPMWGCALQTTAITAITNTTIASNHSTWDVSEFRSLFIRVLYAYRVFAGSTKLQ